MTIRWVFKNGYTFDTVCGEFSSGKSKLASNGMIESYKAEHITKNSPIGIDFAELIAVYRLVDDENAEETEQEG